MLYFLFYRTVAFLASLYPVAFSVLALKMPQPHFNSMQLGYILSRNFLIFPVAIFACSINLHTEISGQSIYNLEKVFILSYLLATLIGVIKRTLHCTNFDFKRFYFFSFSQNLKYK